MKDFTAVGRRLRRYRLLALLLFAIALVILACGISVYFDHMPPTRWILNPAHNQYETTPIPPGDSEYALIMHSRYRDLSYFLLWGAGFAILGALAFAASRKPPAKEVLRLAQARNGLLTLPEVSVELDIDPRLAARALRILQRLRIASPCWQEIRKNLWEFPDYMKLPLTESIELAKAKGDRLPLEDLLNSGHSADTASQTLDTLSEKGLAQQEPEARAVIVTAH